MDRIGACVRCGKTKGGIRELVEGEWYCEECCDELDKAADRALERGGAGDVAYYRQGLEDALGVPVREIAEGGRWPKDITNDSGYLRKDRHPSVCHERHGWTVPMRLHFQFIDDPDRRVKIEVAALACRHCDRIACVMLVHLVDCGCGACPDGGAKAVFDGELVKEREVT